MTPIVSQRINGERLVLIGWTRAILLQMAHPLIAAGVIEHSSFRASPMTAARRLRETVQAMLALTFGTEAEQERTIQGIRGIHRRVHGRLAHPVGIFPAGSPYSAEDPALVLWVHATLIESTVLAYVQVIGPLTAAERDAYCAEAAGVALALGAVDEDVPRTWPALEAYLTRMLASGVLAVGEDARVIAATLTRGTLSKVTGPLAWGNRLITAAWLPADLREAYGLRWGSRDARRAARILAAVRTCRRSLPAAVALWPQGNRVRVRR